MTDTLKTYLSHHIQAKNGDITEIANAIGESNQSAIMMIRSVGLIDELTRAKHTRNPYAAHGNLETEPPKPRMDIGWWHSEEALMD